MVRVFLILLFFSTESWGFTVTRDREERFVNSEVSIDVSSDDCSAVGMNSEEVMDFVEEAIEKYWNRIPHCSLNLTRGNIVNVPVYEINLTLADQVRALFNNIGNNRILVGCNDGSFPEEDRNTLATGQIYNNRGLVFINASDNNIFQRVTKEQRLAVFAHEIGHAFGLGHSADPAALMYFDISGKTQEKLSTDDFDGCAYLYPNNFPGSCSWVPLVKSESDGSRPGGGVGQTLLLGLFLGFALAMIVGGGAVRLWRD